MYKTQRQHEAYWEHRQIDWKTCYLDTWVHPHRQMIMDALKTMQFGSLLELGCASGPNLLRIQQEFSGTRLSGVDINPQAIATARTFLAPGTKLQTGALEHTGLEDKSTDVVLTDMVLIYVADIHRVLAEIKRVVRKHVVFCEFHSRSPLERWALKLATGYRAYDYLALLRQHGLRDGKALKVPGQLWPGGKPQRRFGYLMTASL
jgi:ubiquinone/menaquinone biosynthesis C-methylase UbiE